MTFLASAGQYLATWVTRAGQAYDTGTWGSGTLWSTHYNSMLASRDYWQHTVAHNDADVWNTRYNAGYSAGDAAGYTRGYNAGYSAGAGSKTTSAVGVGLAGTGGLSGSYSGDLGSVSCPRTGLAHCSARVTSNGDDAAIHIFRNGALALGGSSANGGLNTSFAVHGNVSVNAGDVISVRATGDENSGLQGGYLLVTVGSV